MFENVSTTAQRGALDWRGKFREATRPVFEELYNNVANGEEAKRVLEKNSKKEYRKELDKEINEMKNMEMWQAGAKVRQLRPENWEK